MGQLQNSVGGKTQRYALNNFRFLCTAMQQHVHIVTHWLTCLESGTK